MRRHLVRHMDDLLATLGGVLLVAGLWMVSPALGLGVAGALLIAASVLVGAGGRR